MSSDCARIRGNRPHLNSYQTTSFKEEEEKNLHNTQSLRIFSAHQVFSAFFFSEKLVDEYTAGHVHSKISFSALKRHKQTM